MNDQINLSEPIHHSMRYAKEQIGMLAHRERGQVSPSNVWWELIKHNATRQPDWRMPSFMTTCVVEKKQLNKNGRGTRFGGKLRDGASGCFSSNYRRIQNNYQPGCRESRMEPSGVQSMYWQRCANVRQCIKSLTVDGHEDENLLFILFLLFHFISAKNVVSLNSI